MLGICRMLLRDPVEAEDAAQQAFLSAYGSLLAGNRPDHPAAWLATIARNECWARTRNRMRQPVSDRVTEELVSPLPGPVEVAARNADLSALVAAIGALPSQQRAALLMREFSGMSYSELAAALSVSEPAVESLLVRARRELRLRLQPVYAACLAPIVLVRDWVARLGAGSEPALGTVAKLGTAPLVAKLAAGVASVAIVGGVVVAGDVPTPRSKPLGSSPAAVIGVSDVAAGVLPEATVGTSARVRTGTSSERTKPRVHHAPSAVPASSAGAGDSSVSPGAVPQGSFGQGQTGQPGQGVNPPVSSGVQEGSGPAGGGSGGQPPAGDPTRQSPGAGDRPGDDGPGGDDEGDDEGDDDADAEGPGDDDGPEADDDDGPGGDDDGEEAENDGPGGGGGGDGDDPDDDEPDD